MPHPAFSCSVNKNKLNNKSIFAIRINKKNKATYLEIAEPWFTISNRIEEKKNKKNKL